MTNEVDPLISWYPFFTGYRAILLSELGQTLDADSAAYRNLDDSDAPAPYVVRAQLLLDRGELDAAAVEIETALRLDGANLAARAIRDELAAQFEADGR